MGSKKEGYSLDDESSRMLLANTFMGWVELQTLSRVKTNAENMVFIPQSVNPQI